MRMLSIAPANHSPQMALPPSRTGADDAAIGPLALVVCTSRPSTYRSSADPSYVAARNVQRKSAPLGATKRSAEHAAVEALSVTAPERFPALSAASTPSRYLRPQASPVNVTLLS